MSLLRDFTGSDQEVTDIFLGTHFLGCELFTKETFLTDQIEQMPGSKRQELWMQINFNERPCYFEKQFQCIISYCHTLVNIITMLGVGIHTKAMEKSESDTHFETRSCII
jgi:hypothetical protein